LGTQGDYAGSLAMYRRGHELGTRRPGWSYPSAKWVSDAEKRVALGRRLAAILKGEDSPKDNNERLDVAQMYGVEKRFAAAARLMAEAIEIDPKLGESLLARHRHHAAGFAAQAGVGKAEDDPRPDEAARNRFRGQARDWMRVDLGLCSKKLGTGNAKDRGVVVQALQHWKECSDVADIRNADALAKLPEPERKEWQAIWAEVDALLKRAAAAKVEKNPEIRPGDAP
jgi:hypothetical protein